MQKKPNAHAHNSQIQIEKVIGQKGVDGSYSFDFSTRSEFQIKQFTASWDEYMTIFILLRVSVWLLTNYLIIKV